MSGSVPSDFPESHLSAMVAVSSLSNNLTSLLIYAVAYYNSHYRGSRRVFIGVLCGQKNAMAGFMRISWAEKNSNQ